LKAIVSNSVATTTGDGTNPKTILQVIAPANKGLRITRVGVTFAGTSSTAARAQVHGARSSTNGTGTSVNPQKLGGHTGSVTATANETLTVEPTVTAGTELFRQLVPPTNGVILPVDIVLNPGEAFNLRTIAASLTAIGFIEYEE
jgi:hypothetical protein